MTPKYAHGRNKQRYYYYQCSCNNHRGKDGCKMKYVPAVPMERLVTDHVKEIGTDEGLVDSIVEDANQTSSVEREVIAKRRKFLEGELSDVKQNMDNWLDLIGNGAAKRMGSVTSLLEKVGQGEKRRKEIEHQLMELGLQEGELQKKVLDAEVMQDSLIKFRDLFDLASDGEKKYLLQLMVPRIIWTPEEIRIALYDQPTDTGRLSKNSGVNHDSEISLEFGNWLRGQDSNL